MTDAHTHVLATSRDTVALCGVKVKRKNSPPYVLASFVAAHQRSHGLQVCPLCADLMAGVA